MKQEIATSFAPGATNADIQSLQSEPTPTAVVAGGCLGLQTIATSLSMLIQMKHPLPLHMTGVIFGKHTNFLLSWQIGGKRGEHGGGVKNWVGEIGVFWLGVAHTREGGGGWGKKMACLNNH